MTLPGDYPSLLGEVDSWHAATRGRNPGVIPCKPGCAACCHGPFDISIADALLVRDTVAALPLAVREQLRRRAESQLTQMQIAEPDLAAPFDISRLGEAHFDALVERFSEAPCPALDDSSCCLIYRGRPMVCRMMGLGMETAAGDVIENACPIQDEFPDYAAMPPQRFDLARWEVSEALAHADAAKALFGSARLAEYETTVAGAIMLTSG